MYYSASPQEVAKLLCSKRYTLVDVRELHETAQGLIEDARWVPLSKLQRDPSAALQTLRGSALILYCERGTRSKQAAEIACTHGFKEVHWLVGGIAAWRAAGHAIGEGK